MSNIIKTTYSPEQLTVGNTFEIHAGDDRLDYIERTLERLKKERLKQAEIECQALFDKAREEIQLMQQAAHQKADDIVAEGEAKRDAILEQGYKEGETRGFEKGYDDARKMVADETIEMMDHAKTILSASYEAQEKMLHRFKYTMSAIIFHVTKLILKDELEHSSEKIDRLISETIKQLGLSGHIKVVANHKVVKNLLNFSNETKEALCNLPHIQFEADPQLDPFDVYVLSEDNHYVVSPMSQAAQYLDAITASLSTQVSDSDFIETLEAIQRGDFDPNEIVEPAESDLTEQTSTSEVQQPELTMPSQETLSAIQPESELTTENITESDNNENLE